MKMEREDEGSKQRGRGRGYIIKSELGSRKAGKQGRNAEG
jgi:hypothetical protein